ncbi:PREDICTED: uncharacterized protein LOC109174417 [Ipomoea nil]|uniref:uncharacterized protein LOC109174417 n=1 Tax=Ipomoea nil TaxID=35883 RepID=UPI000900C3B7|nr:PREDICTED: uncharacterized protein LOC109174417 [Ipomoea nil]
MTGYFDRLFMSEVGEIREVIGCITASVTVAENNELVRPVMMEEVLGAVTAMHPDKSPGPDGFGPAFYQHFWTMIGGEVTMFCRQLIDSTKLLDGVNNILVVLVPKKSVLETMKDLRPIALCNVLYKVAAKVCANRLKPLMEKLLSKSQSVFVHGRLILHNIMLAFKAHHYLKRKSQGKNKVAALKIDRSKAYGRVEWRFFSAVMLKMGFCQKWVDIIMETDEYGLLDGVRVARGALPISHLLFADDCFIFFRANSAKSQQMKEVLDVYADDLGQLVNYDNSVACFSTNVDQHGREDVISVLGIRHRDTAGQNLGLPSLVGQNKKQILGFLREKVLECVHSWKTRFISRAGREVLLKNVLQALSCYTMMVFMLPVSLCNEIEVILNRNRCSGTVSDSRGIRWKAWHGLCAPKAKGAMVFRKLKEMNLALLGKQAWRLLTRPSSLVALVYKSRYYPNISFLDAELGGNPSYIWRGIVEAKNVIKRGICRSIGDGRTTTIGNDLWLTTTVDPYARTALHLSVKDAPVVSLMTPAGTGWDSDCVKDMFDEDEAKCILNIPISSRKPLDAWVWKREYKGNYTVKSSYRMLTGEFSTNKQWNLIWKLHVPPKAVNSAHNGHDDLHEVEAKWRAPGVGRLKLNTDAAMDANFNVMGLGWIMRDDQGGYLATKVIDANMKPPELDGHNYSFWKARMEIYLQAQGTRVYRTVPTGWSPPTFQNAARATEAKPMETWTEDEISSFDLNNKALNSIVGSLHESVFTLVTAIKEAKRVWEILETRFEGTSDVK